MWLYTVLVIACLAQKIHPSENTTPSNNPGVLGNDVEDETDVYLPTVEWSDTFDWQLLKAVSYAHKGNVLISPLSIKLALVMLYEGSAGSTEKQFQSVLQFPENKKDVRDKYQRVLDILLNNRKYYELNIGTSLFLESSITPKQQYAATVKSAYNTDIHPTNFTNSVEASHTINTWVDRITEGHIRELLNAEDIRNDALLIVANAVYFKGFWRRQFPKNNTHSGGFYVSPTEVVTVPYMSVTERFYYAESKELDSKILRLPYRGRHFSLFIVLPNSKGGLPELINTINLQTLKRQLFLLDPRTVDVVIPKFHFDFTSSYSQVLQDFGLNTIFSNTASFPGIARGVGSGTKWLFVNDVKQKAGIDVNEEGSTAFASTAIQLGNKFGQADLSFNATHPFLIFLEDQITGSILFAGKVENPLQSDPLPTPSRFGEQDNSNLKPVTSPPVSLGANAQHHPPLQLNPIAPQDNVLNSVTPRFDYFDMELLRTFDGRRNYFISPASIKATLGMVLEGARGHCAEEIARVLGLPVNPSSSRDKFQVLINNLNAKSTTTLLEVANGAFISDAFQVVPEYERILKQYYKATVKSLNFANNDAASRLINNWVNDATRGLITDIVTPANFNSDATLVIANALYFKGKWTHEFDGTTSARCFYTTRNNKCVPTKTMQTVNNFTYKYLEDLDAQAVELPYGDGQYAMLVLLPSEKNSVRDLTRDLQHTAFASIVDRLEPTEVSVYLPKFEIDYTADLVSDLKELGIEEIFGQNANLSGIIARGQIKINNIVHKAKVEVNEKGTTAAAATGVIVIPLMGSSTPRFDANRPFLFFIYHVPTKSIIFEGRFNEPAAFYDEVFTMPPQTSKPIQSPISQPLPQPSPSQNAKRHYQQPPIGLSIDGGRQQQYANVQSQVLYPSEPILKSGDNYRPEQASQYNYNRRI